MEGPRREAGILLPLFSLRGDVDWGIGAISDVAPLVRWIADAGHGLLQLLPILETAPGERSPYAALSAFAIDPIYVGLGDVEDFALAGGESALADGDRAALAEARASGSVRRSVVRRAKRAALEVAFARFRTREWDAASPRAAAFRAFREAEVGWLGDYSLYRAAKEARDERPWEAWEPELRDRAPEACAAEAAARADRRLFHEWVQWVASTQWAAAREAASAVGVRLKGDLPFMVSRDSADVWARRGDFHLDRTVGAPPDAFNAEGQDWGLPVYDWDAMAANGDAWLRARVARSAALYDAFRLDHVVGYYRMYVLRPEAKGEFVPAEEDAQRALGERLLGLARDVAGATQVIGEDLGTVPPFLRRSLVGLGIAGYRVLRWEADDGVYRDPRRYPALSVATSGTHDTSALAVWWSEELDDAGRAALAAVPAFAALARATAEFTPAVHEALLDGLYAAGSDLVVVPFPDAYGGRERINVPATVGEANWTYRMPWSVEALGGPEGRAIAARLRGLAARHGRAR